MQETRAGFEVHVQAGDGAPWLTMVHGATQHRGLFSRQVAYFAPRFRLLLVDLPGHGAVSSADGPFGPMEYAAGVVAAMDAAGVSDTHYWGTHTGTQVALIIADSDPERLRSLVLEGAVIPGRTPPSVVRCFEAARQHLAEQGLAAARDWWFENSPWFDGIRARPEASRAVAHRAMLDEFTGAPWTSAKAPAACTIEDEQLKRMSMPTLLVNGECEVPDFLPAARDLEAILPAARRATIAAAGGFPLWEFPDAVNPLVLDFLRHVD